MGLESKLKRIIKLASWKVWVVLISIVLLIAVFPQLWSTFDEEKQTEKVIPVKVLEVKEEIEFETLEYIGVVDAQSIKKVGFKMSGVLEKLYFSEGESIENGDILAQLDTKDIILAVEAAENNRNSAKIAYEFAQENYEKVVQLFEAGAVSMQEKDKAKVEMENLESSYSNARIDYENKLNNLEDTTIKTDISGFVADVLYEQGEIVPAGYPAVIISSKEKEIKIGLSQNDLQKIDIGTFTEINADGSTFSGKVSSIGQLPDSQTRNYPTTIEVNDIGLPIGSTVKVFLNIGEIKGIFIPITAIKNDGHDYVYVIDENMTAHQKIVQLGKIRNTEVMVIGLSAGDRLVIEGGKRLYEGYKVSIQP